MSVDFFDSDLAYCLGRNGIAYGLTLCTWPWTELSFIKLL